jgi:hypothetical protein
MVQRRHAEQALKLQVEKKQMQHRPSGRKGMIEELRSRASQLAMRGSVKQCGMEQEILAFYMRNPIQPQFHKRRLQ